MRLIERERKFEIARGRRVPDLGPRVVLGDRRRMRLTAVYLDTPDLHLTRHKITLRRRTGGGDAGWHLKLPRPDGSRLEVHVPLAEGPAPSRVPLQLRRHLKAEIGLRPLVPVAVMRTVRTQRELRGVRGRVFAVLCDDTVSVASYSNPGYASAAAGPHQGPDSDRQTWRELEIELLTGLAHDRALLDELTDRLAAQGVPVSHSASKVGRFLADRVARVEALEADAERVPTAGEVVLAYLQAQVGVIQGRERDVVRDSPDAVHKSRVAVRRSRSALRTARPLFHTEITEPLRLELKWWGEVLGGPRDAEVIRDRLVGSLGRLPAEEVVGPVRQRLEHELFSGHAAAHAAVVRALRGRRFTTLATALTDLVVTPPVTVKAELPAPRRLPRLLAKALARVDARHELAETAPPEDRDHWLHETRKKAKAARYLSESMVPVFGDTAKDTAALFEAVTEALGEVQDTVVAEERLHQVRAVAARHREPTRTYDALIARERQSRQAATARGEAALAAFTDPAARAWFGGAASPLPAPAPAPVEPAPVPVEPVPGQDPASGQDLASLDGEGGGGSDPGGPASG